MRRKIIYLEKYKSGIIAEKADVIADAKKSERIELLEAGKMSNGCEFITVRIIVR